LLYESGIPAQDVLKLCDLVIPRCLSNRTYQHVSDHSEQDIVVLHQDLEHLHDIGLVKCGNRSVSTPCPRCNNPTIAFPNLPNLCDHCATEALLDSIEVEELTADSTVSVNTKMCPQCGHWNTINWWWHSDHLNRWVCYGCGMGRSREYQQDQQGMINNNNDSKNATKTST